MVLARRRRARQQKLRCSAPPREPFQRPPPKPPSPIAARRGRKGAGAVPLLLRQAVQRARSGGAVAGGRAVEGAVVRGQAGGVAAAGGRGEGQNRLFLALRRDLVHPAAKAGLIAAALGGAEELVAHQ